MGNGLRCESSRDDASHFRTLVSLLLVTFCVPSLSNNAPGRALIVIGANDGTSNDNDVVLSWLQYCRDNGAHAGIAGHMVLLVEPNPRVYASLLLVLRDRYKSAANIVPVNALVSSDTLGSFALFHMVNTTRLLNDCPNAPHWVLYQLSSLSRENVMKPMRDFFNCVLRANQHRPRPSCDGSRCDKLAIRQNHAAYIFSETVPVLTFSELLQRHQLIASDVDVLAIDAQGYDATILQSAFALSRDFFPRVVIFEHVMLQLGEKNSTIELLEKRGYTTDCPIQDGRAKCRTLSGQDVYATHTQRGLYKGVPAIAHRDPYITA
mmetsp:Transcript_26298/g.56755  ORF Transcript_26298/g.56755 Transcript_26298/m.56755 type:complete len:321 (+) Transcript_26298:3-965(+)